MPTRDLPAEITSVVAAVAAQTLNSQADDYTLVLGDAGKLVVMSKATATTLTVPPNSSVPFPTGTRVDLIQAGAGQVTVTAGVGVTVSATPTLKTRAQYSAGSLVKAGTDLWYYVGDLAAS